MKKIKHFLIFLLLGVLLFSLFFPACGTPGTNNSSTSSSEPINSESTSSDPSSSITPFEPMQDNFEDDRINVGIKPKYSGVNKIWRPEDFPLTGNTITEVIDKTYQVDPSSPVNPNFNQWLCLMLGTRGKEKVVDAITQLQGLEFIKWIEPEYIFGSVDDATANDTFYSQQCFPRVLLSKIPIFCVI